MYDGYLTFDGTEVINMERLMTYVGNGIAPNGVDVSDCTGTCEGLGEAVGDAPYTAPLQDQPPWFDAQNPDTLDFAGVLPLEVTGLDGSTRTVEMVNLLGRGAVPLRPSFPGRTIAVSTLLIGRTSAGVEAGLSWLMNVLHRVCQDQATCDAAEVVAFTSCPTPICPGGIGNPDEPLTPTNQPYSPDTWLLAGGHQADPDTFLSDAPLLFRNYLPNPSGEFSTTAWHKDPSPPNAAWGTATVAQATSPVKVGARSIRVTMTPVAGQPSAQTQTLTGLVAGQWYTYETWVQAPVADTVLPYVFNGGTTVLGEAVTVANQWVRRVVSFQAVATTAEAGIRSADVNSSAVAYVDAGIVAGFNGGGIARTDFEEGVAPWHPATVAGYQAAGQVESSTEQAATGLASMKITWGAVSAGRWDDTDPTMTWDTVDPYTQTWDTWPTA